MVPKKLEYLEIFPSSTRNSDEGDYGYGLRQNGLLTTETLVLVDRETGQNAAVLPCNTDWISMVHVAGSHPHHYMPQDPFLQDLVTAMTGVKKLIIRADPRDVYGPTISIKPEHFAVDLGDCLLEPNLADLESIVFEFARDDGTDTEVCEGLGHLVSHVHSLSSM